MCDLNNTGSSDTLYLCDETAGILKFASFDGTWWPEGSAGVAGDIYRGLTGETDAEGDVTLFAIKNGEPTPPAAANWCRLPIRRASATS